MSENKSIVIRTHRPGDAGLVAHLHGALYAREYGLNDTFESYVLASLADQVKNYNEARDRLWVAECDGRIAGCIGIVGMDGGTAQLRWFLTAPEWRGRGLGRELMDRALNFCRAVGYQRVFLWTASPLKTARSMYQRAGFTLTETREHADWGQRLTEERWDLLITPEGTKALIVDEPEP